MLLQLLKFIFGSSKSSRKKTHWSEDVGLVLFLFWLASWFS